MTRAVRDLAFVVFPAAAFAGWHVTFQIAKGEDGQYTSASVVALISVVWPLLVALATYAIAVLEGESRAVAVRLALTAVAVTVVAFLLITSLVVYAGLD